MSSRSSKSHGGAERVRPAVASVNSSCKNRPQRGATTGQLPCKAMVWAFCAPRCLTRLPLSTHHSMAARSAGALASMLRPPTWPPSWPDTHAGSPAPLALSAKTPQANAGHGLRTELLLGQYQQDIDDVVEIGQLLRAGLRVHHADRHIAAHRGDQQLIEVDRVLPGVAHPSESQRSMAVGSDTVDAAVDAALQGHDLRECGCVPGGAGMAVDDDGACAGQGRFAGRRRRAADIADGFARDFIAAPERWRRRGEI